MIARPSGTRAAPAGAPAAGAGESHHGDSASGHRAPLGPFGIATIVASLLFIIAGIAMPEAAEALLRLLLGALAIGFVAARAYAARLPARMTQDVYSPFDDHGAARQPPAAPLVVRELAAELGAADDPRQARRADVPRSVRWKLIDEAARRLSHHHGLRLDDPDDVAAIQALVSEHTWSLIEPDAATEAGGPRVANSRPLPLTRLPLILDDLERL